MLKVLIQVHQTFKLWLVEKVIHIFFILYCFMIATVQFINKLQDVHVLTPFHPGYFSLVVRGVGGFNTPLYLLN